MDRPDILRRFRKDGYIVLRNVLSAEEVTQIRSILEEAFDSIESRFGIENFNQLIPQHLLRDAEIYKLLFHPTIVGALKAILGDSYASLCNFVIPRNQCGLSTMRYLGIIKRAGWHLDSSAEGKAAYFLDPRYRFAKCGIYFQENTSDWGGAIDVVPGTHNFPLRTGIGGLDFKIKTLRDQFGVVTKAQTVNVKAGDAVIFDSRLQHRSTLPEKLLSDHPKVENSRELFLNIPREKIKYVLYWDNGYETFAHAYVRNAMSLADEALQKRQPNLYSFAAALHYPDDFPEEFCALAKEAGIDFACLEAPLATDFHRRISEQCPAGWI